MQIRAVVVLGFIAALAGAGVVSVELSGERALRIARAQLPAKGRSKCTAPAVSTTSGRYCGVLERPKGLRKVRAYLGIPYGESTSGANRWAPPIAAKTRDGIGEAVAFGQSCPQTLKDPPEGYSRSEDCLSLNVWTPAPVKTSAERGLPVMVFIYGGNFVGGNTSNPVYRGTRIAALGQVVVVSMNYRVGALGFLAGIEGLSGNYGFLDQQLALRWVRRNIRQFGGDPAKVTIFGESAGAMSVGLHLIAPGSEGLFRAAIMQSNPYGLPYRTIAAASTAAKVLRDRLGCERRGLSCMRTKSFRDVVRHQEAELLMIEGMFSGFSGYLVWAPVIDGSVIPRQPFEEPITVPAIVGTNANEGLLFASRFQRSKRDGETLVPRFEYNIELDLAFPLRKARKIRRRDPYEPDGRDAMDELSRFFTDYIFTCANRDVMARAESPIYAYQFTHIPSFPTWPRVPLCAPDRGVVCHAAELPFVFGYPHPASYHGDSERARFTRVERWLSDQVISYWTQFAATLDPNYEGAKRWPAFSKRRPVRVILNTSLSESTDLGASCSFWESIGYDLRH